nr:hypothetical protein [Nonomuraea turkmeniaca]
METDYFSALDVTRAFAPVVEANGGGAVLNVRSWLDAPQLGSRSASKAAARAMTNALRQQLAPKPSTWPRCTSDTWTPTWPPP